MTWHKAGSPSKYPAEYPHLAGPVWTLHPGCLGGVCGWQEAHPGSTSTSIMQMSSSCSPARGLSARLTTPLPASKFKRTVTCVQRLTWGYSSGRNHRSPMLQTGSWAPVGSAPRCRGNSAGHFSPPWFGLRVGPSDTEPVGWGCWKQLVGAGLV